MDGGGGEAVGAIVGTAVGAGVGARVGPDTGAAVGAGVPRRAMLRIRTPFMLPVKYSPPLVQPTQ
eukprot:5276758-Prymnesium_polylepis.1